MHLCIICIIMHYILWMLISVTMVKIFKKIPWNLNRKEQLDKKCNIAQKWKWNLQTETICKKQSEAVKLFIFHVKLRMFQTHMIYSLSWNIIVHNYVT